MVVSGLNSNRLRTLLDQCTMLLKTSYSSYQKAYCSQHYIFLELAESTLVQIFYHNTLVFQDGTAKTGSVLVSWYRILQQLPIKNKKSPSYFNPIVKQSLSFKYTNFHYIVSSSCSCSSSSSTKKKKNLPPHFIQAAQLLLDQPIGNKK